MPYRLIAIDLDGTLLGRDGKVSQANIDAVRRALEAGFLVCFATGRNFYESKPVIDEIGHYDAAVFVGGATVVDTAEGEVLHRQLMEPEIVAGVCRVLEEYDLPPLVLQDRSTAGNDYLTGPMRMDRSVTDWLARTNAKVHQVEDLAAADHSHTIRVGTVGPPMLIDAAEAALQARFGERLFIQRINLVMYGIEVIEVFDPSVNKWAGIQHVARVHGIRPEEIVAIGDDRNDLHMIENAGLGVAMGNARDEVKRIADRVIGTHHEDGLAAFLDELVAEHGRR